MKKFLTILTITAVFGMALAYLPKTFAAKPSDNLAGAQKIDWNLSADVMPVPPYGSGDVVGSDTASKLIVNQPNGVNRVILTGDMKGLLPNTTYTVFLSNGYTPYEVTGWDVSGDWVFDYNYNGGENLHDMTLAQDANGDLTGTGGAFSGLEPYAYPWTIIAGSVNGNSISFTGDYDDLECIFTAEGTIAPSGSMSGTWTDNCDGDREGTWATTAGTATAPTQSGSTGWPGLFSGTVQPFTFMTDEYGSGNWHLKLKDVDLPVEGTQLMSVWVNGGGGTVLISDTFDVVK